MAVDPYIQELLDSPIGRRDLCETNMKSATPEARAAARRASKIWLPDGKKSPVSREAKDAEKAARALNYDLEDAVEHAGGLRGSGSK